MASKRKSIPPTSPSPSRSDSARIVESILTATLQISDPDASVNHIAERAGVGIASLYRYFPSKDAIYTEIARRLQSGFLSRIRELLATPGLTMEEAIQGVCRIAVTIPGVGPEVRRALNLSLPLLWSQQNADVVFPAAIAEMTTWLEKRLINPPSDLQHRVFTALAAGRGMVMMSRLYPEQAPSEDVLVEQMIRGAKAYLNLEGQPQKQPEAT